jgi:transposase
MGLTPKDHSTAGKLKLGCITRAGDEALRSTLVVGATAVIRQLRAGRGKPSPWLVELLKRQAAQARGRGAGQQARPHRLEADDHRRGL